MEVQLLNKKQALDCIDQFQKEKRPIRGIEVYRLNDGVWETSMYKTSWFASQRGVYMAARRFVRHQMAGEWLWVELK